MPTTTFALPIARDKAESVRGFVLELLGPRRSQFEESWRQKGITKEMAWLQETPDGALVLVSMEAENLERAFGELAVSETPFDRWYRQTVLEIYGLDLREAASGPPSELLAEWHAPRAGGGQDEHYAGVG